MQVKTKIINKEIETPVLKYSKQGDAGIDLTSTSKWYDEQGNVCYGTNRAFEIPQGYVGLLFPRSSNANKDYEIGERIGQLIILPYPQIEFEEVSELSETERGSGGYGSTGK